MIKHTPSWSVGKVSLLRFIILGVSLAAISGCEPQPVVNEPASNLDVIFSVLDLDETPSDGKVIVVMHLLQNGKVVQVTNASTSCNGVALPYNGLLFGYAERVPIVPVAGSYVFRYSRSGVNTDVTLTVPPRPVFSAPTVAGAALPRSNSFTIRYVAGSGTSVRGSANDSANHAANNGQADDGTHDGLDVSGFTPGAGTLGITRLLESPMAGTGFLSAKRRFETNKTINITWQ